MTLSRDEKILQMYQTDPNEWTQTKIARHFHISHERVRQIISGKALEKLSQFNLMKENYLIFAKRLTETSLKIEIRKYKSHDRSKVYVYKRSVCIWLLKEKYGLSFLEIGKVVNRDHTSIINLYSKFTKTL